MVTEVLELDGRDYYGPEIDGCQLPGHEMDGQRVIGHELGAINDMYDPNGNENIRYELPALEFPGGEMPVPGTPPRVNSKEVP